MNSKTKVLVVGLGSIGLRHARLLSEREDIELSICEMAEETRKTAVSVLSDINLVAYPNLRDALHEKPDVVFVCVPDKFHVPVGLQAIESGADIFVEKPVSDSIEPAKSLVAAAGELKKFMQVGYMLRLDEGLKKMKSLVENGDLGNLVGGRAMIGTYITLLNAKSNDREVNRNSLIVDYTHELDFIRWFFGNVIEIKAMSSSIGKMEKRPDPNIVQILLKMENGALVQVHMDYIQFPQRRIFEIYGDKGTLSYDFMTGKIKRFHLQKEHVWEDMSVMPIMERWDDLFRKEHEVFLNRRLAGIHPFVSGEDGLYVLELAKKVIEALGQG
jgi:predicted dehydrogenase